METELFGLKWKDFESNISSEFRELREKKDFFDVTLACDDEQIQAHKVILSACSQFFQNILRRNPHQHPLLYLKGVKFTDLQLVLNYMYHGEVLVAQEELISFLAAAEELKVKGLAPPNSKKDSQPNSPAPPRSRASDRESIPSPKQRPKDKDRDSIFSSKRRTKEPEREPNNTSKKKAKDPEREPFLSPKRRSKPNKREQITPPKRQRTSKKGSNIAHSPLADDIHNRTPVKTEPIETPQSQQPFSREHATEAALGPAGDQRVENKYKNYEDYFAKHQANDGGILEAGQGVNGSKGKKKAVDEFIRMGDFVKFNNSDDEEEGQSSIGSTKIDQIIEDLADKDNVLQPEPSKPRESTILAHAPCTMRTKASAAEPLKALTEIPPDVKPPKLPPIPSQTPPPPPPIFSASGKPGRNTNQLIFIKQRIMPALWAHKFGWPFKKPVDAAKMKLPDYHIVIQKPMDFGTIRKRLSTKYYWSSSECIEDINQVFRNSLIYNKPGQDITIMTQKIAKFFETKIALMMEQMRTELEMEELNTAEKRQQRASREAPLRKRSGHDNDSEDEEKPLSRKTLEQMEPEYPIAKKSLPDSTQSTESKDDSEEESEDESDPEEQVVSDNEWMF